MIREEIRSGKMPSVVFKAVLALAPNMINADIADAFVGAFPGITGEAMQAIWHWERPGRERPGLSDDRLDAILLRHLKEGGFLD